MSKYCAIANVFRSPLNPNSNDDRALADEMKTSSSTSNELQEKESLSSERAIWSEIFPEYIQSFPRLTENDLIGLTLGVYHSVEHMSSDGSYRISIQKEDSSKKPNRVTCLPRSIFLGFR